MGNMARMLLYGKNGQPDADAEDTDKTEVGGSVSGIQVYEIFHSEN